LSNLYTLKDHFKDSYLYLKRTVSAAAIVIFIFLVLIGRLIFLQFSEHEWYASLSLNNQVRIVPIHPPRGLIFDRNGVCLADNAPAFSLELTPSRTPNLTDTLTALTILLHLTESEQRTFYKQLKLKHQHESVPIRVKLTEAEVASFIMEKHRFPGVEVVARLIRHYPLGEKAAHALGYIGPINEKELETLDLSNYRGTYHIGKTAIEKYYESELHGTMGFQHVETDARGRTLRVLKRTPPKPGKNLHLSIDSRLQEAAYDALGELSGVIIAIDPKTGEVLAMVSKPSFDPKLFTQGIDTVTYEALRTSPDRPLFNRAITGQYPPGSIVKPFVALKALELGIITPEFSIFDPGWYQLGGSGRLYRDWIYLSRKHGHGTVNLEKAIMQSCDTYFFTIAHRMGVHNIHAIYSQVGFGKTTGIDMAGEMSGLAPSAEWKQRTKKEAWYPGDTLNIGVGQGYMLVTPLQAAEAAAVLANKGQYFKTHIVQATSNTGEAPMPIQPQPMPSITYSAAHWDQVIKAMQKVVHTQGGTAHKISHGLTYTIAGKTGTAQVFNLKQTEKYEVNKLRVQLRDHSWFMGFAPVEEPQIAIVVLIENKYKTSGSDITRIVLDHFFENLENTTHPIGTDHAL
jgi:penicillin-binding protein 2